MTAKSQEVEKVHSTSKALGDEADDTYEMIDMRMDERRKRRRGKSQDFDHDRSMKASSPRPGDAMRPSTRS